MASRTMRNALQQAEPSAQVLGQSQLPGSQRVAQQPRHGQLPG
jgi:hypothetical protein